MTRKQLSFQAFNNKTNRSNKAQFIVDQTALSYPWSLHLAITLVAMASTKAYRNQISAAATAASFCCSPRGKW
eukprot:2148002-Amphidinium_carterae.2